MDKPIIVDNNSSQVTFFRYDNTFSKRFHKIVQWPGNGRLDQSKYQRAILKRVSPVAILKREQSYQNESECANHSTIE